MSKQVDKVLRNSEIFAVINTKLQLAMEYSFRNGKV